MALVIRSIASGTRQPGIHERPQSYPNRRTLLQRGGIYRAFGTENRLSGWTALDHYTIVTDVADFFRSDNSAGGLRMRSFPKPAGEALEIRYTLSRAATYNLVIIDIRGSIVQTLFSEVRHAAGEYSLNASLEGLNPGMYFLQLSTEFNTHGERFLIVR